MSPARLATVLLLTVMLAVAAAGLASVAVDDDPCDFAVAGDSLPEGSSSEVTLSFWPPGTGCDYLLPSGGEVSDEPDTRAAWIVIFACGLLLLMSTLRRRSPLTSALGAVGVGLSVSGMLSLLAGFPVGFVLGMIVAPPLLWFVGYRSQHGEQLSGVRAATLGALVSFAALAALVFGAGIAAYAIAGLAAMPIALARWGDDRPTTSQ